MNRTAPVGSIIAKRTNLRKYLISRSLIEIGITEIHKKKPPVQKSGTPSTPAITMIIITTIAIKELKYFFIGHNPSEDISCSIS